MVEANIVRDFTIGNTRIKIADDYCRTAGEAEQILRDITGYKGTAFVSEKIEYSKIG